nr:SPW repeat protein [Microvirga massiliensis]
MGRAAALLQQPHRGLPCDHRLGVCLGRDCRVVRRLHVPLGLWIAASPFLLDGGTTMALVADVVVGWALAALSLPRGTRSREHYGGWDRYIR